MSNSKTLQEQIRQAARIELGRRHLRNFTAYTFQNYNFTWFHDAFIDKVNDFAEGKIKKLMVFIPPQHGKSEISTRRLPAYLFGKNPNLNIGVISYNDTKAKKFNREIKRIMKDPLYSDVFPEIKLPSMDSGYTNSANEFDIMEHSGTCKTIGVGGALTGDPIDILIMDDLYKDAMSAWSSTIRNNIKDWYDSVADTRLHNESQQLIVFTRWHPDDLAGRLLKLEPEEWDVVIFEAIKDKCEHPLDKRKRGEALYPEKHSIEKLEKSRKRNPHVFESLFQQNPKPLEGLLYSNLKTYSELPFNPDNVQKASYTDTADTGSDYLCTVVYAQFQGLIYVLDVQYNDQPQEVTEPETAAMLTKNGVNYALIESNNGGRAFARNVEAMLRRSGNNKTRISWFHQSKNKEVRIKTNSSTVQNVIVFPENWMHRFPQFYNDVTNYMAKGKNEHDDAADVLTGIVEQFGTPQMSVY